MRLRGQHRSTADSWQQPGAQRAPDGAPTRLGLLTEAARGINAALPQDELLQRVADSAREVIGAHQAVISLTTNEAGAQSIAAISLSDKYAAWREYDELPDGGGIYSLVVRHGEPMRLTQAELEAHPAYRGFGKSAKTHPPLRGWLAAPLLGADGKAIGLIQLSDKTEGDFSAEDEDFAVHLAQLAVLAIDSSRVRQEATDSGLLLDAVHYAAPVGFAVLDEELRYVRVNEALAEMNGIPVEDHIGRSIGQIVPEISDDIERALRGVLASGTPTTPVEVSGKTLATGEEVRHWLVSYYPVTVSGARGLGCVVIDITEPRNANERLRRSEERYRMLVDTTEDMIWTVGADGCFDFVSGAVERVYGYMAAEVIGKPFLDFVPAELREENRERFSSMMEPGYDGVLEVETELLRKDGSRVLVHARGMAIRDDEGRAVGVTGASTDVTERRRSEEALRASEERFRGVFENAGIGMALMNSNGDFVQANPAFSRLLGRTNEELSELSWADVIHPDDRELAATRRERHLAGETDFSALETRFLHKEGHCVWTRLLGASVRSEDGDPNFTLVQVIDLTEQRRLEETTGRLYALTRDLFCTVGADGYFKSANPAWERALGYPASELLSRPFLEFVADEDRPRTAREFERLRANGDLTLNFDNRYVHKDGTLRWLLWSAYVTEEGLIYGVAKDVTDRKRSEDRLRESERKYRDLVETSSDLIWSVDKTGHFTFVNRAARRIYGYEPEEMLGRPIGDFETEEQRLKDVDAFRGVLTGTPLFSYETRHIRKDGRPVDLSVNAIVLHDDNGATLGATGTATDVTDRKRFEARQAAVAELGRQALEGVGLAEITEAAVALVSETLGLEYAVVFEFVPGEERLFPHAGVGLPEGVEDTYIPAQPESSHAAYAIQLDGPVVVEDFEEEHRFGRSALIGELGARSGVCVTIEGEARPFGALCGHTTRRRTFMADEVNFLQAVANVLATAIGRKRQEEQIVELAAARGRLVAQTLAAEDRARRSISEVLHDHALQDLLASRQDLVEVIEEPDGDPERAVRAREGIERAVQLLREAVFNLHPVVLEHAGLASAIRAVADHQGRRGGFDCKIEVDEGATGVHDELILSLARELLTNVAKHAGAEHVGVDVRREDGWIVLTVEDDGHGIERGRREAALREGHVGLASSTERVEALAGHFEVEGRTGGGTRARAALPARRDTGGRVDRPKRLLRLSGGRRGYGRSDPLK
ncbi:MAG TPA: PAS domain S-box protein [Thermoleophilaceae bacterium]